MIQLRWLVKETEIGEDAEGRRVLLQVGEKVLQYREVESPHDYAPDWQDVPTVIK